MKRRGRRPVAAVFLLVATVLAPARSFAVDVPFTQLFFGRQFRSLLDDAAFYPACYVSSEGSYWDIYHERRDGHLHDYKQYTGSVTTIHRRDAFLLGASVWTDRLALEQENVYTDTDRMDGHRDNTGGKIIAGYTLTRDMPLALTSIEMVGAAGGNGEWLGDIEARLSWSCAANLLLKFETFSNELEMEEDINGSAFPFHFPYRTERGFGRLEINEPSTFRFRAWGLYETNSGEGDVVEGFENRLWFARSEIGGSVDYRLAPAQRLDLLPRLSGASERGPGVRLRFDRTSADVDAGMHYGGVRYLHLDGLQFASMVARADVVVRPWLSVFGGWERLALEHQGDSFFDVWPFTIWDIFEARRYRLGDFESSLDTWFVGGASRLENGRFRAEFAGRFEWWDSSMELDWLERVAVLFPFFFRYESHHESVDLKTDYALQIDAAFWWQLGPGWVRFSGRSVIPIEKSEASGGGAGVPPGSGAPGEPSPHSDTTHGGLIGTLELVIGY